MSKNIGPIASWMQKRHLKGITQIEEANHGWEGWSEKDFVRNLRDKNIIGMVSLVSDVVGAYVVYELREKEIFILKWEEAKELAGSRVGLVLMQTMKRKAVKMKKDVKGVFPEYREDIPKYQFFAKNGFSSALRRNFFPSEPDLDEEIEKKWRDGYEFKWEYSDFKQLDSEEEKNDPK